MLCVHRSFLLSSILSSIALLPTGTSFHAAVPITARNAQSQSQQLEPLHVSIGLGPEKEEDKKEGGGTDGAQQEEAVALVAGVDYEVPNHEEYRTSRRSKLDVSCDEWFGKLLDGGSPDGILGPIADQARKILTTPVELKNDIELPIDDPDWTPYVSTRLPWTPLTPSYGLEQFGLPIPRRNAETWRHFDVPGMIAHDYSSSATDAGTVMGDLDPKDVDSYQSRLMEQGAWLEDDACLARLVYIDGRFAPQLSKEVPGVARNLDSAPLDDEELTGYLSRLTDGFTDELATPVSNGPDNMLTSYKRLSGPNHAVGDATSQFAVNAQQGTACFAALNTVKSGAVAYVHAPAGEKPEEGEDEDDTDASKPKPVLIVNAVTPSGGLRDGDDDNVGVTCHPRTLVVAEEYAHLSVVQSCVDLEDDNSSHRPKLYNGYTQFFIKEGANVTHSYLEETGGIVTAGVELSDEEADLAFENGSGARPREVEAQRPELKDTHLEAIDVHIMGGKSAYEGTVVSVGGSGHVRLALSVSLLSPEAEATVNGFCLSGGTQRADVKTNIHHIAQGTTSRQVQKNMIGGRSTGSFRGRIRVEQSAQQTDSEQLSRSVLLSDKARAWAIPSLEIIADDVKCTHGSTVSDLSEEELFYLRSRGLGRSMARNLLMYAFAGDVCSCVDPVMLGSVDSSQGLQKRVIRRLENLVPQGERALKGEFQSI